MADLKLPTITTSRTIFKSALVLRKYHVTFFLSLVRFAHINDGSLQRFLATAGTATLHSTTSTASSSSSTTSNSTVSTSSTSLSAPHQSTVVVIATQTAAAIQAPSTVNANIAPTPSSGSSKLVVGSKLIAVGVLGTFFL